MNTVIIVSVIMLTVLVVVFLAYRTTRPSTAIPPRRRELNRAREVATSAQDALTSIGSSLDAYGGGLDDVGLALAREVREAIRTHDQKMREINK